MRLKYKMVGIEIGRDSRVGDRKEEKYCTI